MDDPIDQGLFGSSIFKNEQALDQNYLPERLPHREETQKGIARSFRPLFTNEQARMGGFASNIAIIGPAGVGKTSCARLTLRKIGERAEKSGIKLVGEYFSCWVHRTRTRILSSLLANRFGVSTRGFSDEESLEILVRRLRTEKSHLIIILDEVNILPSESLNGFFVKEEK